MFKRTRIKLTTWYLLILMSVTLFFSLVIHTMLLRQVKGFVLDQRFRIERRFGPIQPAETWDVDFIEDANRRITLSLLIINASIFIVGGALAYFMAGKTLEPIKNMVEEQNRFITDSSHELRTPLTSLKLAMEVAARNPTLTLKQARSLITENIAEVNRLQELSNRLLRLSSGKSLSQNLLKEKMNLGDVLKDTIKNTSAIANDRSISIKNNTKFTRSISGNKADITELFSILLENAIKYSPQNEVITLSSKEGKTKTHISVSDKGIGISKKDLSHIFNRFFRSDQARSKAGSNGFGLGLSIAKKIAEDHHGHITVKTKVGQGSTFTVHLPS